jgi:hypothetical protein
MIVLGIFGLLWLGYVWGVTRGSRKAWALAMEYQRALDKSMRQTVEEAAHAKEAWVRASAFMKEAGANIDSLKATAELNARIAFESDARIQRAKTVLVDVLRRQDLYDDEMASMVDEL